MSRPFCWMPSIDWNGQTNLTLPILKVGRQACPDADRGVTASSPRRRTSATAGPAVFLNRFAEPAFFNSTNVHDTFQASAARKVLRKSTFQTGVPLHSAFMRLVLLPALLVLPLGLVFAQEGVSPPVSLPQPAEAYLLGSLSTIRATVEKVDAEMRLVTLKTDQGKVQEVVADPEVANLAQIKAGDQVTMKFQDALSFIIVKKGTPSGAVTEKATTTTHAPEGSRPAGEISGTGRMVAAVAARDLKAGSVTLKLPDGTFRVFTVKDPARLEGVGVGDQVVINAGRKVAVAVTPPPP